MDDQDLKWFYNQATGQVEQGKVSSFENRMGPYDTREEAAHALDIAKARNAAADAKDEADDDWGKN
ncbi:hypothetical protein [Corynebacterium vitaeruminis]|uniref:SPOR domain-containing protein n=1 Tax=Corynebacterium vitaeruminis DSM 20294 TaxID=1224164 RepID=W5Y1U1_9CORY|nr:hypothetical protein [Corynebacterium vitaeruminis]AHI23246.1 hypothetical protein B843_09305 [Corynebacterium vitaeruminis DSM 20294]